MASGYSSLSDKEKETLRLLLNGYDAKSIARHFNLSVYTVHERLRNARQKMSVSSSREAARMLGDFEANDPKILGDKQLGEASFDQMAIEIALQGRTGSPENGRALLIGGIVMSLILAAFALSPLSYNAVTSWGAVATAPSEGASEAATTESDAVIAARQWLSLVDVYDWNGSWNATGSVFKQLNTAEKWAEVAENVQPNLGSVRSRNFKSQEFVPAPPMGYEMVKFHTNFASKPNTTETLTLVSEGNRFRVVGYWID